MSVRKPRVYLAPMEGVVDHHIRQWFSYIGGYDQMVTEFIRVNKSVLPNRVFYRYCPELYNQGNTIAGVPVYIQLLGSDPYLMAENAAMAIALGAPGIDLNFGCPAKTVNRHDGGATLLKDPDRIFCIVEMVKKHNAGVPITAKVRLGFDDKSKAIEIAKAVEAGGADRLTIHARTKKEGYRPPAHWEYISLMRESIRIPVVANGDIWTLADYLKCRDISGCQDVALGRAAMANPFLARQIQLQSTQPDTTWLDVLTFLFVFNKELGLSGVGSEYILSRHKQWLKMLARQFLEAAELFEHTKTIQSAESLLSHLQNQLEMFSQNGLNREPLTFLHHQHIL